MKFFSFILSAYLLFLVATPCCAMDECRDDSAVTGQAAGHENDDNGDCGNCSPFFTCSGCNSVSIHQDMLFSPNPFMVNKKSFSDFYQSFYPRVYSDFWQPPKMNKCFTV